ncbi:MAG: BREX-2 system adenine-specific DNA-methyltransferase PglX, partial [Streptosporangiaceae bacterium]
MIVPKDLVADLQKELRRLERDLLASAESSTLADAGLRKRYVQAVTRSRTGLTFEVWRGQQLTQVAAGWVLACVYTRFSEDNRLLDQPMLAGPGDRLTEARERQTEYFRTHSAESDLGYLRAAVHRLEAHTATRALVDRHNPMWLVDPSPDAATDLLNFWRRIDPETGALAHDFTDEHLGTRFLGDLYQDMSEQARKDYALLQTPDFIEEFILDRTLDPAINEYGLAEVRLIDPACGSGHFLLGAFARLLNRWREQEPGTNVRVLVERALGQVYGVDINPYAAAIAEFRLVVAALTACRITRLADAPTWKIHVAIGDSLRFRVRSGQDELAGVVEDALTGLAGEGEFVYEYEDAAELQDILGQRYQAVVANPPYITVKDPILNGLYRELWSACSGKYALSVPFAQRLFDLAVPGGFTGQITSNSFMKREFGKKLIEQFFARVDLNLVIDTSGAYIPGHGTPTVIICGRNRRPMTQAVHAVLGIRGEPGTPAEAAKGLVWTSITELVDSPGKQSEYVSVTDLERGVLARYPWSLSGGGAGDVMSRLEAGKKHFLNDFTTSIGFAAITGDDEVYVGMPRASRAWRQSCVVVAENPIRTGHQGVTDLQAGTRSSMIASRVPALSVPSRRPDT